jgi:SSS family solute:Na+ symporter
MSTRFFVLTGAYFALVLGAGLAFRRRMRGLEDFFLASRRLPAALVWLSLVSAWFGASSILVTVDEALKTGVSAVWIVGVPAVATVLLLAFVMTRRLRRLGVLTLPDLAELRYGRTVRHLVSALIIWYMVLLAASQMVALGRFLEMFLGLSYASCLVLGTAVVLVYTTAGGLRSVVFTDVLQFVLLAAGVLGLFFFLAGRVPLSEIVRQAAASGKPGFFSPLQNIGENALIALSFTLAWTISPIALQRIQAARSEPAARAGLLATAGTLAGLYAAVVAIGIFALPLYPGSAPEHPLVSALILEKTGFVLGGLVFAAVLAAILSTMDTAVNTGALALTRDVVERLWPAAPARSVTISRLATFVVAAAGFLVATRFQNILKTIGLASEIMAEGLFVPGLAMIFLKKRAPAAGLLSLTLGGGFSILSFLSAARILPLPLPAWPRSVPFGLGLSLAGFCLGLALRRRRGV